MSVIIHPALLENLFNFYPDTCTIQTGTASRDAVGEKVYTWANVADHVDIPCARGTPGGAEAEGSEQGYLVRTYRIALQGHYPTIAEGMRALYSDGTAYDIERVRLDQQATLTYLDVEIVS